MMTLPGDVATGFGLGASVGSIVCFKKSLSCFSKALQDPTEVEKGANSFWQKGLGSVFGKASTTLSSMARQASEGVFWAISSVAFGALAMVTLDPEGKHSPSNQLKAYIPLERGPALFSEDFATRLNPLNYKDSALKTLGSGVEYLSRTVNTLVTSFVSHKVVPNILPQSSEPTWWSSPLTKAQKSLNELSASELLSFTAIAAAAFSLYRQRRMTLDIKEQISAIDARLGVLEGGAYVHVGPHDLDEGGADGVRSASAAPSTGSLEDLVLVQRPVEDTAGAGDAPVMPDLSPAGTGPSLGFVHLEQHDSGESGGASGAGSGYETDGSGVWVAHPSPNPDVPTAAPVVGPTT